MDGRFPLSILNNDIVSCDGAFTPEELASIDALCGDYLKKIGQVTDITGDPSLRKSDYFWVPRVAETEFFYVRMAAVAREINETYFNFDLTGRYISDGILYLDYNQPGDHFDWHMDNSKSYRQDRDPVKVIAILQLTDPRDYEGSEVEVAGTGITTLPKKRGLICAIPGYASHRVRPLISGRRSVLSCWFTGPKFK